MNSSTLDITTIQNILSAQTEEHVITHVYTALHPYHLAGVVYSGSHIPAPICVGIPSVHRWVEHFVWNKYFELDPLYQAAQQSVVAQHWHTEHLDANYTPEQRQIYKEIAQDFGLIQGFDLTVHDAVGKAALCFYFDIAQPSLKHSQIEQISKICALYAHERIRQLAHENPHSSAVTLSQREITCLKNVQNGKTYAKIANELGITSRTVSFHLQNAKKKLQVSTLAHAIARAVEQKLI